MHEAPVLLSAFHCRLKQAKKRIKKCSKTDQKYPKKCERVCVFRRNIANQEIILF